MPAIHGNIVCVLFWVRPLSSPVERLSSRSVRVIPIKSARIEPADGILPQEVDAASPASGAKR